MRFWVIRHAVIPASRGGKVKTATQTATIVLALAAPGWTVVLTGAVLVSVLWTVGTGVDYGAKAAALARAAGSPLHPLRTALPTLDPAPQQGGAGGSSRISP